MRCRAARKPASRARHLQRRASLARSGLVPGTRTAAPADRGLRAERRRQVSLACTCTCSSRCRRRASGARRACGRRGAAGVGLARRGPAGGAARPNSTRLEREGHVAFVYCNARGERVAAPNGSARGVAGLANATATCWRSCRIPSATRGPSCTATAIATKPRARRRARDARPIRRDRVFRSVCRRPRRARCAR